MWAQRSLDSVPGSVFWSLDLKPLPDAASCWHMCPRTALHKYLSSACRLMFLGDLEPVNRLEETHWCFHLHHLNCFLSKGQAKRGHQKVASSLGFGSEGWLRFWFGSQQCHLVGQLGNSHSELFF